MILPRPLSKPPQNYQVVKSWNLLSPNPVTRDVNLSRNRVVQSSSPIRVIPWILVGVFGTLWLTKSGQSQPEQKVTDSLPMLVKSLRDLGFLQSKEVNLQENFQFETSRKPAGWASAIPGADSLVSSATKNEIWVAANGQVRAGFDLSKAKLALEGDTVRVVLPKVTIQQPHVDLKLQSTKAGLFWKDNEITLKAIGAAKERFSNAAVKLKVEREAFSSAERHLRNFLGRVTPRRIIIEQS